MTKTASYRENEVSYSILGNGNPLYLLHGFCANGSIWDKTIPVLKKDFQLIIPDLPGYGDSELPNENLSITLFADAIEAIIEQEKHNSITIAGHSMGGYILCELLARKNKAVQKGIMINSHPYADDAEKIKNRTKSNTFIKKNGENLYVKELYKNLFAPKNIIKESEMNVLFEGIFSRLKDKTIIQSNLAMINRNAQDETLGKTSVPIQFIIGKNDQVIDFNTSLKQCVLPKISDVQIFQKTGHLAMIEETKKLVQVIRTFSKTDFHE